MLWGEHVRDATPRCNFIILAFNYHDERGRDGLCKEDFGVLRAAVPIDGE